LAYLLRYEKENKKSKNNKDKEEKTGHIKNVEAFG
jgi:hypothetical protein